MTGQLKVGGGGGGGLRVGGEAAARWRQYDAWEWTARDTMARRKAMDGGGDGSRRRRGGIWRGRRGVVGKDWEKEAAVGLG